MVEIAQEDIEYLNNYDINISYNFGGTINNYSSNFSNISDNASDVYIPLCNFGGFQVRKKYEFCL